MQMTSLRLFFQKTGRAKYISHLDTMRTMTRALRRSGLPLWYTEGFNPHLYLTFALPLSLGYESLCESVDVRLVEELGHEEVVDRMNASLPEGFQVIRAAAPVMEPKEIAWGEYYITLHYREVSPEDILDRLTDFVNREEITVLKRTKKGEKELDIKPLFQLLSAEAEEGAVALELRMASGITTNINPSLLLNAFFESCVFSPARVRTLRTGLFTGELKPFQ